MIKLFEGKKKQNDFWVTYRASCSVTLKKLETVEVITEGGDC